MIIRRISKYRWEDAVPCRIGGRMGRPEKSDIRKMKPKVHSLFPLGENGAMRLTTARYYTPAGRSIQALGVVPDIIVEQ